MRIIDKTPLIEEDGKISFINRVQGTLKYGFSWYPDLQAQEKAMEILAKQLSKKFTLIRNHTLGKSKITVPFILIGPPGVQVIFVTHLEGSYQAKNDAWGAISKGNYKEASINLLKRTARLGKAVDVYLKREKFDLPNGVESVLFSVNPALHVDSVRPIVRIVMSDAATRFTSSLAQKPPVMSLEDVHRMAEAIVNPRPPKKASPPQPEIMQEPLAEETPTITSPANDNNDFDFAFEDDASAQVLSSLETPKVSRPPAKKGNTDFLGMTQKQLIIIAAMGLVLVCLLIFFILGVLFFS